MVASAADASLVGSTPRDWTLGSKAGEEGLSPYFMSRDSSGCELVDARAPSIGPSEASHGPFDMSHISVMVQALSVRRDPHDLDFTCRWGWPGICRREGQILTPRTKGLRGYDHRSSMAPRPGGEPGLCLAKCRTHSARVPTRNTAHGELPLPGCRSLERVEPPRATGVDGIIPSHPIYPSCTQHTYKTRPHSHPPFFFPPHFPSLSHPLGQHRLLGVLSHQGCPTCD